MTDIPRVGSGSKEGGQFATMNRPEARIHLTEPLSELEQKRLRRALDRARNTVGNPLSEQARRRLVAVATDPTEENWEAAYGVVLTQERGATLWQSVVTHSGYPITKRPVRRTWPQVPSREQILFALDLGTRKAE